MPQAVPFVGVPRVGVRRRDGKSNDIDFIEDGHVLEYLRHLRGETLGFILAEPQSGESGDSIDFTAADVYVYSAVFYGKHR